MPKSKRKNQPPITGPTVACPMCGRKQPARCADSIYACQHGCGQFDADPDEGSPETYNDPVRSLEAKERRTNRRSR